MAGMVTLQRVDDHIDQRRAADHPDLHRIRHNIGKNTVQLFLQKVRCHFLHTVNAGGVLRGQRRDGAHGVHLVGGHGFDVLLDARSPAAIRTGYGQYRFHSNVLHFVAFLK